MLTITESAKKELDAFFSQKERACIRIYLGHGGCSGAKLAIALDNPNDDDVKLEAEGYDFCIEKSLLEQIQGATLDLSYMGFVLEPTNPLPKSSGSCSTCGGSCGH